MSTFDEMERLLRSRPTPMEFARRTSLGVERSIRFEFSLDHRGGFSVNIMEIGIKAGDERSIVEESATTLEDAVNRAIAEFDERKGVDDAKSP